MHIQSGCLAVTARHARRPLPCPIHQGDSQACIPPVHVFSAVLSFCANLVSSLLNVISTFNLSSVSRALSELQQLAEAGNTAAVLQKVVPTELLGSGAALDINAKADT
jgi:hypothetical protein